MIAVINYGLGNLHSVVNAVQYVGGEPELVKDPDRILQADKLILPGVGAFADGMKGLVARDMVAPLVEFAKSGKPLLGICLGMQLLFEASEEMGCHQGLGLIEGEVKAFVQPGIKIPQIGWNQIRFTKLSPLKNDVPEGSYVYFNHSYYCELRIKTDILTSTVYGTEFASSVQKENLIGVQFHPEKSQKIGLQIIKNFMEL